MAYDRQFLRISYGFIVEGSDEIADTSISYSSAAGWTGASAALGEIGANPNWSGDVVGAFGQLMEGPYSTWASYSSLNSVKIAAIGTDGAYLTDPLLEELGTPLSGLDNSVLPQSTIVLSLRSGLTLGKGNYGRMYLPHTRLPLDVGSPKSTSVATAATAVRGATFVNDLTTALNTETTATIFPVIMSQTGIISKGITQVAVGDVTDTQRRRRNRLTEVYSFEDLA